MGRLPDDSFMERVDERDGEFGSGGTLGARLDDERLEDDKLFWGVPVPVPVGDVGDAEFGGPGLLVPPFLPPPLNLPLLQRDIN